MALAGTVDKSVVCVVCGKNGLSCGKNAIHWHTGARHSAHLQMTTLPMTDHFNAATTYSVHLELGLPFIRGLIWRGRQTRLPYAPAASGREPSWSVPGWTRFAPTPSSSPVSTSVHHRRVTPPQCSSCHAQAFTWLMTALMRRIFSRWPLTTPCLRESYKRLTAMISVTLFHTPGICLW